MRLGKWLKLGLALTALGVGAAWAALHFVVPDILLRPQRASPSPSTRRLVERAEDLEWRSNEGLRLRAHCYEVDGSSGRFLVLHGISSCKDDQAELCAWLNSRGFEAVAFDLRAHGESEGEYCTFGFHEKEDVSAFLDQHPSELPTFIWGSSLGGAVALQALGHDKRLRGGVVFSAFATLEEIALDRQKQLTGLDWAWLRDYTLWRCGRVAGIDPRTVAPEASCGLIEQPVLLVHGSRDGQIAVSYGRRNYAALASPAKLLIEVDGAGHGDLWERGGVELQSSLSAFLDKSIRP